MQKELPLVLCNLQKFSANQHSDRPPGLGPLGVGPAPSVNLAASFHYMSTMRFRRARQVLRRDGNQDLPDSGTREPYPYRRPQTTGLDPLKHNPGSVKKRTQLLCPFVIKGDDRVSKPRLRASRVSVQLTKMRTEWPWQRRPPFP